MGTELIDKTEVEDVGVVIGRFQTPYLHDGHLELLRRVSERHIRVLVFIGQSPNHSSKKNPLDFGMRQFMVAEKFPNVEIHCVEDVGDDLTWSANLDRMIRTHTGPEQSVLLYGSRDSFTKSYKGRFKTTELKPTRYISASEVRKQIGLKPKNTQDFREGVVWGILNTRDKVVPTVDVAIMNKMYTGVMLGRKANEPLYRFIGGHQERNSPSVEYDATREALEEANVNIIDFRYISSPLIDSWKYRGEIDKLKTVFFAAIASDPENARVGDDMASGELKWFRPKELKPLDVMPEHRILVEHFNKWFENLKNRA